MLASFVVQLLYLSIRYVAVLCLDTHGSIAAGISTSGPPFKMPGRVGDSPLPGCGLYADDQVQSSCTTFYLLYLQS